MPTFRRSLIANAIDFIWFSSVQSPDGKQKTIPLSYDASGKHYADALAEKATG